MMSGGEQHVTRLRVDERAGCLADPWRDARDVSARHVHQIDLIEGIARLTLALEHELTAVLRPVPLAGASSFYREATNPGKEVTLGERRSLRGRALRLETCDQAGPNHGRTHEENKEQRRTSNREDHRYP